MSLAIPPGQQQRPLRTLPLLLLAVAALGACASRGRTYHDQQMDFGAVKTVAVLPLTNLTHDNLAADRVRDVFSNMLLASGTVYVIPPGEVMRGVMKVGVTAPSIPSVEEAVKLGQAIRADALVTGVVKEYGEVRSGSATANVVSISMQMIETATGKVVWSGSSTKGGITMTARLFGGGGVPVNDVTEEAVRDVLGKLLK